MDSAEGENEERIKEENQEGEIKIDTEDTREREFRRTIWTRLEFIWRITVAAFITLIYLIIVYLTSQSHYSFLYEIVKTSNNTVRLKSVGTVGELFHQYYYYYYFIFLGRCFITLVFPLEIILHLLKWQ